MAGKRRSGIISSRENAKGLLHIVLAESTAVVFKIKRIIKQFKKSMCITNPSKISVFRENLLHMLLFWTLILFDSYAYSYKNRGCRMCNSPFFSTDMRSTTFLKQIYYSSSVLSVSIVHSCYTAGSSWKTVPHFHESILLFSI